MGVITSFITGRGAPCTIITILPTWWNKSFDGNHWWRKIENSIHTVRFSGLASSKLSSITRRPQKPRHKTLWQMETNTHQCRWSYLKLSPSNWNKLCIQMPKNEFCPNWTLFFEVSEGKLVGLERGLDVSMMFLNTQKQTKLKIELEDQFFTVRPRKTNHEIHWNPS